MANSYILEVKDLKKSFGDFEALKGISFKIKRGEILGFLGPNGAGKTTTIHCLLGLTTPTSGSVTVFGKSYTNNREEILSKVNFSSAYVSLPERLTVYEALQVYGMIYGVKNLKQKINELLELFQIQDLKDKLINSLSSGQRTRASFAKALINDPELLLLDEPMASLDPEVGDRMREFMKKVQRERQISILYTSHNMPEVERLCDRIIFINRGELVAQGTPTEITRKILGSKNHEVDLEKVFISLVRSDTRNE